MSNNIDLISLFLNDLDQLLNNYFGEHFHYNIVDVDYSMSDLYSNTDPSPNFMSLSLDFWTDENTPDAVHFYE